MSEPGGAGEFAELAQFALDERSVRLLKARYCEENQVVILGVVDARGSGPVTVGMLDPDPALVAEISRFLSRPVRPVRLNAWEIRRALDVGYGREEAVARDGGLSLRLGPVEELTFDPAAPIPLLIDEILGRAVELGASDVHVESYEGDVDVRLRLDGVLRQVATALSRDNIHAAIARLKVLADLDVAERRKAQDGRIRAVFADRAGRERPVDFRLSVVPGPAGEDAVLRVLDSGRPAVGLTELGFPDAMLATFERMIASPEGLILVTGPTGSGKTTTLYAALHRINTPANKILTVEDPIEYFFPKVNQKQVSPAMGFADYARAFMRQNPDVILIGEIRDEQTADVALRAAQTGHLVFSTLHTNDAVRTLARLEVLGVDRNLIAGTLLGALSQRLLRRLCPHCRAEAPAEESEAERLGLAPGGTWFRARGCDACAGTGYRGRIGCFELFRMDEEIADLITTGAPVHRVRQAAIQKGMPTLLGDALAKAEAGETSLAEILRAVPYRLLEGERGMGGVDARRGQE
jgi:type II secretory ATPase GspE/PulE/Tfp pilus assembly ATPase PilB-like protein